MAVILDTNRQTTWTSIGTNVDMSTTVDEVLETANLNYEVVKQGIYLPNGKEIVGKKATVNPETGKVYGIVSDTYQICQNRDAFQFIANIDDKLSFVKAGETATGMVYIIARLDDVTVLGDTFTPYVIFQNGHNGNFTLKTTICPLRIVCNNQFAMSFKNSSNNITIRHFSRLESQMREAEMLLKNTATYMKNFNEYAEELANVKVHNEYDIIRHFFEQANKDKEPTERQLRTIEDKVEALYTTYKNTPDNANFQGTAWGLLNGFTDYNTHLLPQRKTDTAAENRFTTVTMDPRVINHFMQYVMASV